MYGYDALTIPANLAGNCAISIPVGEIQGIPVGMQIMCDKFQEQKMLQIANAFEDAKKSSNSVVQHFIQGYIGEESA